ncbi:MAG: helicase-related protein, partial [Nocardioidaceae bacterium]
ATDVAARGIHVDEVACVVHFDPPADAKDYTHRSGRTGRAGADGVVVSFVTDGPGDAAKARLLKKALGMEVGDDSRRPRVTRGRVPQTDRNRNRNRGGHRGKRRG